MAECRAPHHQPQHGHHQTQGQGQDTAPPLFGLLDRAGQGELGVAVMVEYAPIGTNASFHGLPRLVEGFHQVVADAVARRLGDELADDGGLCHRVGPGLAVAVAARRPAEFGDDRLLPGEGIKHFAVAFERIGNGILRADGFPVGQHVDRHEIDLVDQVGMGKPAVPGFAGGHRHGHAGAYLADDRDQFFQRHVLAQQRFVADEHGADVGILADQGDRGLDLPPVGGVVAAQPDAEHDLDPAFLGKCGHLGLDAAYRIGAHGPGHGLDDVQGMGQFTQGRRPPEPDFAGRADVEGHGMHLARHIGQYGPFQGRGPGQPMQDGGDQGRREDVLHLISGTQER